MAGSGGSPRDLEQISPLVRGGEVVAVSDLFVLFHVVEIGADLDELLRVGETDEVYAGALAHGRTATVAADQPGTAKRLRRALGELDVDRHTVGMLREPR